MRPIVLSFALVVLLPAVGGGAADWAADVAFLRAELPRKHIDLHFLRPEADFERDLSGLRARLGGLSDIEVALRLQEVVARLGDEHTSVAWQVLLRREETVPIQVSWFADGGYVVRAARAHAALLGKRILAVGGVPWDGAAQRFSRIVGRSNPALLKHAVPGLITALPVLRYLELGDGTGVRLRYEAAPGEVEEVVVAPVSPGSDPEMQVFRPAQSSLASRNNRAFFWKTRVPDQRLLYVQFNRCIGRDEVEQHGAAAYGLEPAEAAKLPSLDAFFDEVLAELRAGGVDRLVIDMRRNNGGSSLPGARFAEKLARSGEGRPAQGLFVIIGRQTFSSGVLNAIQLREHARAVLVGEATRGRPNHFGEVRSFKLPSSGLSVSYSTKRFRYVEGDPASLEPDVPAETSFAQFVAGVDAPLEAIAAGVARGRE